MKFPPFFQEDENQIPISFIKKLLNRFPEGRMDGSYASLKSHKFFEDFDWNELNERRLDPPYIPPHITF